MQCRFDSSKAEPGLLIRDSPASDEHSQHFCMAKPTKYDVMIDGRKVGGGAQRRTKHGFLHQGTLALAIPSEEYFENLLVSGTCVAESMHRNSYSLLGTTYTSKELSEARLEMQALLYKCFSQLSKRRSFSVIAKLF